MGLIDFLHDIDHMNPSRRDDWLYERDRLSEYTGILWYGGSGLDICPIFGALFDGLPSEVIDQLGVRPLFIYSDYSSGYRKRLINEGSTFQFRSMFNELPYQSEARIENLFRIRHRTYLQERSRYHKFGRTRGSDNGGPLPLKIPWRGFFIKSDLTFRNGDSYRHGRADLLWLNTEVLETWNRLFEVYDVKPTVFLTLRTGGKSGSWMNMRDPHGPLMSAVANTQNTDIQPIFWVTDDTYGLNCAWPGNELSTRGIPNYASVFASGREGYGLPKTFKCDWPRLREYCETHLPGGLPQRYVEGHQVVRRESRTSDENDVN
jgi:hypothetical protein